MPKKIHTILTETLACFLPGRVKDLSAPLYLTLPSTILTKGKNKGPLNTVAQKIHAQKFVTDTEFNTMHDL